MKKIIFFLLTIIFMFSMSLNSFSKAKVAKSSSMLVFLNVNKDSISDVNKALGEFKEIKASDVYSEKMDFSKISGKEMPAVYTEFANSIAKGSGIVARAETSTGAEMNTLLVSLQEKIKGVNYSVALQIPAKTKKVEKKTLSLSMIVNLKSGVKPEDMQKKLTGTTGVKKIELEADFGDVLIILEKDSTGVLSDVIGELFGVLNSQMTNATINFK